MCVALLRFLANDHEELFLTDLEAGNIESAVGSNWIKLFAQVYSFVEMMKPN